MLGSVVDYAGRQLDLELLSHVEKPVDQRVRPTANASEGLGPSIVAGMEKVVQRYAKLFLTEAGSVKFNESDGGTLLGDIRAGRVQSMSYLSFDATIADRNARETMKADDANKTYGEQPADERIASSEIVSLSLDEASARIKVHVRLETEAGTEYNFVVPVRTGIS